jgi:hypothetical protein
MPANVNPLNPIGFLTPFGPRELNEIPLDAVLREQIDHTVTVTRHPVEVASGNGIVSGTVSDNAFLEPIRYTLQGAVSDFPISWRLAVDRYANATAETRSLSAYQLLLKHFREMVPFVLVTPFGEYANMLFTRFSVPRDRDVKHAIIFNAELVELQIVVPDHVSSKKGEDDVSGDQAQTQAVAESNLGVTPTGP